MVLVYGRSVTAYRRLSIKRGWWVLCVCGRRHEIPRESRKVYCGCGMRLLVR